MKSLVILLILFFQVDSQAISIIGNRYVQDQEQGFRFPLFGEYIRMLQAENSISLVTAFSKFEMIKQEYIRQPVEVRIRLRSMVYPQWAVKGREELRTVLEGYGWQLLRVVDSCADVYFINNGQTVNYLAAWGEGKGFLMSSSVLQTVNHSMDEMVQRLEIFPGACSWK